MFKYITILWIDFAFCINEDDFFVAGKDICALLYSWIDIDITHVLRSKFQELF